MPIGVLSSYYKRIFLKKDLKNTLFFHLFVTIVIVYVKMNATKYGT